MKKTAKSKQPITAEAIGRQADSGKDVSRYFTNNGRMMPPVRKIDVDLTDPILNELDEVAIELNISRQAVIKTFVRESLDRHYLASQARKRSQKLVPVKG